MTPIFVAWKTFDQDRKKKRGMGIEKKEEFIVVLVVLEELVEHHLERSDMQLKI